MRLYVKVYMAPPHSPLDFVWKRRLRMRNRYIHSKRGKTGITVYQWAKRQKVHKSAI